MKGVSVIVCTFNGATRIVGVINAIIDQEINCPLELVIVDNNSTDDTYNVCQQLCNNSKILYRLLLEQKQGLIHARKRGVLAASYSYLIFVDDDNILKANYCQNVFDLFEKDLSIGACGGKTQLPLAHNYPLPEWWPTFSGHYAVGDQAISNQYVDLLWGAGLAVRRQLLLNLVLGNYPFYLSGRKSDTLTSGDDSEICYLIRLSGFQLYYSSTLLLDHNIDSARLTNKYLSQMMLNHGRARPYLDCYNSVLHKEKLSNTWFRYIRSSLFELIKLFIVFVKGSNRFYAKMHIQYQYGRLSELFKLGNSKLSLICREIISYDFGFTGIAKRY